MQTADVKTTAMALRIEAGPSVVLQLNHTMAQSADKIQSVQETDAMTSDQWGRPLNGIDLGREYCNTLGGDNVAKVFYRLTVELTLLGRSIKLVLAQSIQHLTDMVVVLRHASGEHKDIVHEDDNKWQPFEDCVHEQCELGWRVGQAEWHDKCCEM